jgi:predicted TIM-barrel fold metal-dependent hydrolase
MSIFDEEKIDTHCHVLDPARFPYAPDVAYRPAGPEIGPLEQYEQVMDAYGIRHALLVGPNSGYGLDNRCLLHALAQGQGRFKGIAVVPIDIGHESLREMKAAGVIGVAFNATLLGTEHYAHTDELLRRLAELDMLVSLQVEHNQLIALRPLIERTDVRVLIDHCGRPAPWADRPAWVPGLAGAGPHVARRGRVAAGVSGYQKFSTPPPPYHDTRPRRCSRPSRSTPRPWASDWPFACAAAARCRPTAARSSACRLTERSPQALLGHAAALAGSDGTAAALPPRATSQRCRCSALRAAAGVARRAGLACGADLAPTVRRDHLRSAGASRRSAKLLSAVHAAWRRSAGGSRIAHGARHPGLASGRAGSALARRAAVGRRAAAARERRAAAGAGRARRPSHGGRGGIGRRAVAAGAAPGAAAPRACGEDPAVRAHAPGRAPESGERLLQVKVALAEIRVGHEELARWRGQGASQVAIGSLPMASDVLVPQATALSLAGRDDLRITVKDGTYESLMQLLRRADVDFVVGPLRGDVAIDLVEETLLVDRLVPVVRSGYPALGRSRRASCAAWRTGCGSRFAGHAGLCGFCAPSRGRARVAAVDCAQPGGRALGAAGGRSRGAAVAAQAGGGAGCCGKGRCLPTRARDRHHATARCAAFAACAAVLDTLRRVPVRPAPTLVDKQNARRGRRSHWLRAADAAMLLG